MQDKKSVKKLITHNGSFHTDDVFACATLSIYLENKGETFEIIRTRDKEIIDKGDYVFDVGDVYDEKRNRFDHHQPGGAGSRTNGIDYSSFGLVWKKFGLELCGTERAWELVGKDLVAPVDAGDNGQELFEARHEVFPYLIQNAFSVMVRTWKEDSDRNDKYFLNAVSIAKKILEREIIWAKDATEAEAIVITEYQDAKDKKIIVLSKDYPFESILSNFPEPLFVIHQRGTDGLWAIKAVRDNLKTFKNRKGFPSSWAGLRDEELQKISGVPDAIFCHRGLFMAVAKSREGAIKLAELALLEPSH